MTATAALPTHPLELLEECWPHVRFYDKQLEIIRSAFTDDETWVCAGNKLGKDFVAGFVVLAFFLTRRPCRVVCTSVKDDHLDVLWGEIGTFVETSRVPLDHREGGPLIVNQRLIRRVGDDGKECKKSYVKAVVASPDKVHGMQGHHLPRGPDYRPMTMFLTDESSGVPSDYYVMAQSWQHCLFGFGNPWTCDNEFRWAFKGNPATGEKGGDIPRDPADPTKGYERRTFSLGAEDSPNVKFARWEMGAGREPSNRIVVPGVKDWREYQRDRRRLSPSQQVVKLDGQFYEGAFDKLFPPDWLGHAEQLAFDLDNSGKKRTARGMGVDPAEGGDDCAWNVVDEFGVLEQVVYKTPDTSVIPRQTLALLKKWRLDPGACVFDRGGGGKQHVDALRASGVPVRALGFGAAKKAEPQYLKQFPDQRHEETELADAYTTRRCEMYDRLSMRLNPAGRHGGFGIPRRMTETHRQLAVFPRVYDGAGRLYLPPKQRKPGQKMLTEKTLVELLGCSPDEADSLALAVWAMENPARVLEVG